MRRLVRILVDRDSDRDSTTSACVRGDLMNIRKAGDFARPPARHGAIDGGQNGLTTARITIRISRTVGTSLIILKNFCDLRRRSAAKSFT